jgi:hypothetical protein
MVHKVNFQHIPRITFGMIVLNGEPFTRYNLRSIYPWAHQIIVVEGACLAAVSVATVDGHSTDGTLDVLHRFKKEEDPENKIVIVTAEDEGHPNGFWPGEKNEMSQMYAKRATGNYLWQVDSDEFYRDEDIEQVCKMLMDDCGITAMTFRTHGFWGSLQSCVDGIALRRGARDFHRLFKWAPGYSYTTHRPPTVIDEQGRDLRSVKHVTSNQMSKRGIFMYHYLFLFPFQVLAKNEYYGKMAPLYAVARCRWVDNYFSLQNPFFVCSTSLYGLPSWLVPFQGKHPHAIGDLFAGIDCGELKIKVRRTDDIFALLGSSKYRVTTMLLLNFWVFRDTMFKLAVKCKHSLWCGIGFSMGKKK